MTQSLTILQLYPNDMNIYGDWGNTLTLKKRLEWRGINARVLSYNPGDSLPDDIDIIVAGGGQDSGQEKIHADLLSIGSQLKSFADNGMPMLVICGMYQLFGHHFTTIEGKRLDGISVFDAVTIGKSERLIGNIITESDMFGEILGYENHSGQTYIANESQSLARVRKGAGNNLEDGYEGARFNNVIGSYLHGSLLPKNPRIADFLISTALTRKYGAAAELASLDDSLTESARKIARTRER